MQSHLTAWDLVLTPLYLVVLVLIAKRIRDKHYPPGHQLRKYYLPGLYVKFGGAIFVGLLFQFYYVNGDTYNFFYHTKIINSALDESVFMWIKLLLRVSPDTDPYIYKYTSQMYWYYDTSSYTTASVGAIFGLLNGTTYMPIALLFAFFSYTGIWAMYRTFIDVYPTLYKPLAFAFLFIPSTVVWGSGFLKDTICMFGLGWMTYTVFRTFVNRDFSTRNMLVLLFSFYLVFLVKVYILVAFIPALTIWLLMTYSSRFRSTAVRWTINIAFVSICLGGLLFLSQRFSAQLGDYSLDNLAMTAIRTKEYINSVSEDQGGAGYDLGDFAPTIQGMMSKFPQAVVVTYFRPWLWEVKKPIMLLSALESLALLLFLLYVFYKRGIGHTVKGVIRDPNLTFFFIYSIIFGFAVGISTGNFGSLSRYKIPCMPFFVAFLLILYYTRDTQNVAQPDNFQRRKKVAHQIS